MKAGYSSTPKDVKLSCSKPDLVYKGSAFDTWNDRNTGKSHLWNAISCMLPVIEVYAVKSISQIFPKIKDSKLGEEARVFCQQEAAHACEHQSYNQMLYKAYPGLKWIEKAENFWVKCLDAVLPRRVMLGLFVFIEHLTSTMGHIGLEEPEVWFENADPVLCELWQWHAIEEVAHKAVCYDIHKLIGGGYGTRLLGSFVALFGLLLPGLTVRCLYLGLYTFRPLRFLKELGFYLLGRQGVVTVTTKHFFQIFKKNYKPWDLDSRTLIDSYKENFTNRI